VASRGVGIWRLGFSCTAAAVLVASLTTALTTALAQENAVTEPGLNWVRLEGADDCLSAAQLADKVEVRVGRTLFVATTQAALFVDGTVRGAPKADGTGRVFDIKLQVSRPGGEVLGERELSIEGSTCSIIDDAVSLVIAVTLYPRSSLVVTGIPLDPNTAASLTTLFGDEPTDPDPSSLPKATASTRVTPKAQARAESQEQQSNGTGAPPGTGLSLDPIGAAGVGQMPNVRVALGGYLRIFPRHVFPFDLGLAHYFVATEPVPEGGGVDFSLTTVSLTGCPWSFLTTDLRGCVGFEGGVLASAPRALAQTGPRSTDPVLSILVGLVFRPRIAGPLHLRAALLAGVPLLQHEFVYQALDGGFPTLFQTSPIHGRADFGLGVTF